MKKYKLLRQSKKVSAVVLAASVMMTSIPTETIVYASDTEVETAAQSEEAPAQAVAEQEAEPNAAEEAQPIAAETEAPETETDTPEITEVPAEPETPVVTEAPTETEEQPTEAPTESATEETEQPTETKTPAESETETSETELSEAVGALQERINALPSVEEFQAMADGTTVEDSTLNQKQMDVYNEAQAIADALDQLSEEEQGQVDTSKLEALFEYFNSMTEETATTISPVTSGSKYINSGGTYTLKGGTYSTSASAIIINTTAAVTLNIEGDITATSSSNAFIYVRSACSNLTINGNGHTVTDTGQSILVSRDSPAIITITGGVFTGNSNAPAFMSTAGGTLTFRNVTINNGGLNNYNSKSKVNIEEGTVFNCVSSFPYGIAGGIIRMTGGTINGNGNPGPIYSNTSYDDIEITGGSIIGGKYGINLTSKSSGNVKIGGSVVLNNNTADVYLYAGKTFTINENYQGKIKVALSSYPSSNTKRQITKAQSTDYQKNLNVISANSNYSVNYDTSGKYLYMWNHSHTWSYSASGNTVTAKCTSDSNCGYTSGLTMTLNASDMPYSGAAYDQASITNEISSVTGASAGNIEYYSGSTKIEAPVNAGSYTAKVTIGGQTATADFKITKDQVAKPDKVDTDFVYNGQEQTYPITDSGLYTVTGNTQTNAGTYTVTVSLKDKTNSEWADGTTDDLEYTFKIAKAESAATVTPVQDLTYANDALLLVNEENVTGGTVYYRIGTDGEWTQNPPTAADAGEYEVFYYVKGDANHEDKGSENEPLGSCKVTIAKKQIEASADGFEGVYDENASHTIQVTVTDPAEGYKITYSTTGEEGSYTEENPVITEVGEHTVYYRVEAGNNYQAAEGIATIKITGAAFADGDITAAGYEGTYDGASHKISVETKGTADGATVTYSTTGEADSYTDEVPGFKNATDGTKTVYYKVSKKGYQDVNGSVEVSIARKNVTATVSVKEKEYDGTTNADVEASVDTGIKNETLTVSGVTGTFASKDAAENIEVSVNSDTMTVIAGEGTKAENYNVSCETKASGKITAKPVTVAITANGGTYGSVKAAEAVLDGVTEVDQGAVPVKLTYTGNGYDSTDVPTQAGTYTVTASIDNKNYVLTGTTTAKFVIAKAEVAAPEIASKQYNGETQTADVADTGLYTVTKNEGGQKVGSYPVILTLKDTSNYKWESTEKADLELTFEIKAIQNTWTEEPSISGWTYGDTANAPEGSAAHGTVSVSYAKAGSDKFTSEVPTEAGNYTARFTVEGTDSCSELTKDVSFTVAAREVTVTVAEKTITYGDAEPEYTSKITEGSLVGEDDLKLTYSREQGNAAKTYAITAASANSNYKVNVVKGTLTIQKKDLTITPKKASKVYGDADPKFQYSVSGLVKGEKEADILTGALARAEGENKGTYVYEIGSLADASGNYNVKLDADTAEFTITAKEVILTWSRTNLTYNGSEQSVTAQVSNPAFASDTFTLEYTGNTAANAGSYTAEVTSVGNDNYVLTKNSNQKVNWSIAKTDAQYQLPEAVSGLTYNGADQTLVTAENPDGGTWMYKVGDGKWSDQLPAGLDAGSYTVFYKVVGDDNHKDSTEGQLTVTIAKKAVVVSGITAEDKTYDGNTSAMLNFDGVKFDGIVGEDSLNITASGVFEDKNAGQKKVLISNLVLDGASAKNYVLAEGQQSETAAIIKAKEITATITPNGGTYEGTIIPATTVLNGLVGEDKPEITLTYTGTANDGTEADGTVPTHAGTYTVTASIADGNYSLKAEGASAQFVVAKADPALSVSAIADKNYGEEAFKLESTNKGEGQKSYASSDENVVTVDENGLVTIVGAGKATLTVSLAESANYTAGEKTVTVTVKKIDHSLVVEKIAYEVTYGDPAFKIAASAGDKETDIKFASNDKDVASVSADGTVTVGKVGTAKIKVSMDESQNYLAVAKEVTVTVVPKEVTVTPENASKVYGDKDGELSYRADGLVGKDTLSGIVLARAEGEDVGTYEITASEKKNANPNYSVKFGKGTFTITQKEIGLTWADTELTYNGKDQQPKAEAAGLVGEDTCEVTVTGAQKNAGTYTATAVKLSNPNYKLPSEVTTQYTIGAKEIGIEWSNLEFTYDGTKKQPTAKATGLVDGDTCGITVSGAAVAAGTHTAKAESVDNANYKLPKNVETEFVINKADADFHAPEGISGLIYAGEAQDLVSAGQTEDGKFVYKVNDGEWSETLPSGLDAGTYEISYKVVGDDNHKDSKEGSLTVTIAKKAVVVSGITAENKTYDGNTSAVLNLDGVKFDGLLEKDSLSVSAEGTFENKNAGEKKVLVSGLTLDGTSVKNYVLAAKGQQSETTAAIKAKEITAVITPNGGTYEGTITPATAILNGLVGADDPEITLTYTGTANDGNEADGTVPTHAGTYTVTASITDGNYSLKAEGASAEFVVAKADPALSVSAIADKNYGEEAFKLETSNKGDGQKSYTSSDAKVVAVDKNGLVTIVGAGKATLTVSLAESANYTAGEKTVTVTVKKIDHSLVVEKIAYEVTYGDPAFKIAASAGDKETDIKFASNDKDVASVSADGTVTVGNVGTAKIKVSMDESQNYLAVAKEVTVTVVPKEVTVTPANASKVYGDKDGDLNYRADGLVGKDTLSGITLARAEGEDVGTYEITASEKKNANPNYSVKFGKGTFTITQKEIGLTWADTKLTYNGKDQQPSASATGLVGKDTCEVTVTGAMKNAGTYTATAVKLSNSNYKLPKEVTTQYTIGAKEIGIEWSNLEFTYDGTKKQPTAKATGLVDGDTCEITVSGAAAEAGTHTAKAESTDNANYKLPKDAETEFVINKAEADFQAPESISDLTYNGEDQVLITAGKTADGTILYKVEGSEWAETLPAGLDAGTYTVSYKVAGDGNHKDSKEGSLTVTIAKKAVVVSGITAEDKTYDGNTSAALKLGGVKFDGLLEKDSLSVTAVGAFEDKNAGQKKVLVSSLTLGGASIKNYVLAEEGQQSETTAAITAKEITAVITSNGGTYEGTITPATAVLNGLVGEDNPEITLTYAGTANDGTEADGNVPTHAGTYTVTASISDGNYSLKADGASAQFVVAKADPALSVSAVADKNYGEEAFKLESTNKGDGAKSYTSSDEKVVTVDENGLVTIVGAGKATLAVSLAESANYTADQAEITVTVKKIDHSLVIEQVAYEVTYGDPTFSVAAQAGDTEAAVKYASSNEDVASVDENGVVTIKNAGETTITLEMAESGNYNAVAKTVTVTVLPKAVTVTPDAQTKVYEEADPDLTYTAEGLVGEDTLADITLARAEGENAGTYDITAEAKEGSNPNYSITCNKGTFTIKQKPIDTAEVTLGAACKYTGKEQTQNVAKVTLEGKEIPADAYTVENNTATEAGTYTLTIKAKEDGNYTGTRTWTYVIAPVNDEQITETPDGEVKIGKGTVKFEVKAESGVPSASLVTGKAEIIEMLVESGDITADELAQIAEGASVDIVLTVKDGSKTISDASKAQMEKGADGYTIGQYLNISLFKYMTVDGVTQDGVQLYKTAGAITISVQIPNNLINTDKNVNRTYGIVRNNDGEVSVLDTSYNADSKTLTFQTNLFSSDYAIAYKDTKVKDNEDPKKDDPGQEDPKKDDNNGGNTGNNGSNGTSGNGTSGNGTGQSSTSTTSPKTGDTTNVAGYGMTLLLSLAAAFGAIFKRKKKTEDPEE